MPFSRVEILADVRTRLLQEHLTRLAAFEAGLRIVAPTSIARTRSNWASWLAENLAVIDGLREELKLADLTGADIPSRQQVDVAAMARFYTQHPPLGL